MTLIFNSMKTVQEGGTSVQSKANPQLIQPSYYKYIRKANLKASKQMDFNFEQYKSELDPM